MGRAGLETAGPVCARDDLPKRVVAGTGAGDFYDPDLRQPTAE
jgi:hypothetical protein